ncbi:MAG: hypothetical protein ACYTHK_14895 [Planctomycetota bacterium]
MWWCAVLFVLSLSGMAADSVFTKKKPPRPGDWLASFHEPGQTFEQDRKARPVRANKGQVIRFVPIGPFSKRERALLETTVELTRIWYQLPVEIAKPVALPKKDWQRKRGSGVQYHTRYFLDHLLPPLRDEKAVTVCGITMRDL